MTSEEEKNDPNTIEFWLLLFKSLSRKEIDSMLQVLCWSDEFRSAFKKAYRIYDNNQLLEKEDT